MDIERIISCGDVYLGIELGSTRIKAVIIDDSFTPIASGEFAWQNRFENGFWTYSLQDIISGLKACYSDLAGNVRIKYGVDITSVRSIGVSGMMHGYLAFDKDFNLLVPFRTWRNTTNNKAAEILSQALNFNIPQRWSIAHLYQAILNNEPHLEKLEHITTLAGYIHYLLTGRFEVGIGEASGIFPVRDGTYDCEMVEKFQSLLAEHKMDRLKLSSVLPTVRNAGESGAYLTESGAALLDESGKLSSQIPVCPPEGDAGTGMVATNSIRPGTGSISAGTSIFSMIVLDKPMSGHYKEIGVAATPDGSTVAMTHCNNCCFELDEWVNMFGEFANLTGNPIDKSSLYELLYKNSLNGDVDCSGITAYNYLTGEPVAGVDAGKIMYFKEAGSTFNLANFFRTQLYSAIATLRIGADILFTKENVVPKQLLAHGGLFKVGGVAQKYVADAFRTPTAVMSTAGEGGPWGMALLASYMIRKNGKSLADYLSEDVFGNIEKTVIEPSESGADGFDTFLERYKAGLELQKVF